MKQSKRAIRLDSPKRSHANKCFNSDARTSVSPARLHFLPAETALTRNWHSPRSHSGTLSSRKRSGSLGGKKTSMRIAFYTKRRTTIFAKPISRTTCKPSIFLRPPLFFFFHYMVANHDRGKVLFLDKFCSNLHLRFERRVHFCTDFHNYSKFKELLAHELSRNILYLVFLDYSKSNLCCFNPSSPIKSAKSFCSELQPISR